MKKQFMIILFAVLFVFSHHSFAADTKIDEKKDGKSEEFEYVQAEVREWYTFGDSFFRISFFTPFWGRGESIIEFNGIDAPITLGTIRLRPGVYWLTLEGSFGSGDINGGKMVDTDSYENWMFLVSGWEDVWSESVNEVDGDVSVVDTKLSLRIYPRDENPPYYLDLTAGYIYYRERLHITRGYQTIPPLGRFGGLNSTYEFEWESYPVGLKAHWDITGKVRPWVYNVFISGSASAGPIRYRGKGVWNLRTDLKNDPSFDHEANEGYAILGDVNINYQPKHYMTIGAGYQYFHFEAQDGTETKHFSDGTDITLDLDRVKSLRHGPYISFSAQF